MATDRVVDEADPHSIAKRAPTIEEMLRAECNFSAAVFSTVAALVVVVDREGRIVRFNRACEQASGYSFVV